MNDVAHTFSEIGQALIRYLDNATRIAEEAKNELKNLREACDKK